MSTRRRFIAVLPLAGVAGLGVLSACGDKAAAPAAAPAPSPAPAAAPAAAPPVAAAPAAVPTGGAGEMVDPAGATAVSLGYVADAKTAKDAKYVAGSACANCALYTGKAGDAAGPCPLYAGKLVAAAAWCTAYVKKG